MNLKDQDNLKSFKQFINEKAMTAEEAFRILNIDTTQEFNLKNAYRSASKLAHPDLGGTDEQQKLVNLAYETLKDKKIDSGLVRFSNEWWEKQKIRNREKAEIIDKIFRQEFNKEDYLKYFKQFTSDHLIVDEKLKIFDDNAAHTYKFHNEDNTTVFYISMWAYAHDMGGKGLGTGTGLAFKFSTNNYLYHNRRKQKMKQRTWSSKNNTLQMKPEELFPKKVLTKVFAGKKQRKFSKRDMLQGLDKELNGRQSGDWVLIPIKDKIQMQLSRSAFGAFGSRRSESAAYWNAYWLVDRAEKGKAGQHRLAIHSMKESEETLDFLVKLVKKMKKLDDAKKMASFANKEIKKYIEKNKQ